MDVRITNREDPDQTASDPGMHCLSRLFWQATSIQNFRTFTKVTNVNAITLIFIMVLNQYKMEIWFILIETSFPNFDGANEYFLKFNMPLVPTSER